MPRRRMIDPSFWDDHYIGELSSDERLLVLGCVGNADDEGRLKGHPAYLKAAIFMYDNDKDANTIKSLNESCLGKMEAWPNNHPYRMVSYENAGEKYIYFPSWYSTQAPSHPQPSHLPVPPEAPSTLEVPFSDKDRREIYERDNLICQYCGTDLANTPRNQSIDHVIPLTRGGSHSHKNLVTACKSCNLKKRNRLPEEAGMKLLSRVNPEDNLEVNPEDNLEVNPEDNLEVNHTPTQVRSGQSSQGKVSIGQVSTVQQNFTKFLDTDIDLTDFLMTTLTKNISAGRAAARAAQGTEALSSEQESTIKGLWGIQVLKKCWSDGVGGDIPQAIFDGAFKALKQYPLETVAKAFAKGVRYKGGKHKSWKYIQAIIDEELEKRGIERNRSP